MFEVRPDNKIVPFGTELMKLFRCSDGAVIVTATRTSDGIWAVEADGVDDVTAPDREAAIMAMTDQATAAQPGTGYSTQVPNEVFALP